MSLFANDLLAVGSQNGKISSDFEQIGSAGRSQKRTFWDINLTVGFPCSRWGARPFVTSPIPYGSLPVSRRALNHFPRVLKPHPLRLALQWRDELATNTSLSRAILARREGVSRARATQIMHLLELPSEIQDQLLQRSGDQCSSVFTERKLQEVMLIQERQKQLAAFRELLQSSNA